MSSPFDLAAAIPVLTTPRLTLRGHTLADFQDSAAMWRDPDVTRFIGGRPQTGEEAWTRLLRNAGHWALLGFGSWVVRETATGRFIGEVGFQERQRDLAPSIAGLPEMGWVLASDAHGRGYATEATLAALTWSDARTGSDEYFASGRTVCLIDPDNQRSLRLADRIGYREFVRATYHGQPVILLERSGPRPEGSALPRQD